jgi:hypothetical protein
MFLSFFSPCFSVCVITHSVTTLFLVIDNSKLEEDTLSVGGHVDCQK